MKVKTFISICLAAVAAGLLVFWNLRGDSISSSARPTAVTDSTEISSERVDLTTDATEEPVNSDSSQLERSAVEEAIEDRLTQRQQGIADTIYQTLGSRIVQTLTDSGLALSDSEEIARRYAADMAECIDVTFTTEAARQSMSVDELFARVRTTMDFGDLNLSDVPASDVIASVSDVMDLSSMVTNVQPCIVGAIQGAGISFQSVMEDMMDQFGLELP